MSEYRLESDEYLVLKSCNVYKQDGGLFDSMATGELMLTNKTIVYSKKNLLGKIKEFEAFPLSAVKVFNDQAQVFPNTSSGSPTLEIYLSNGVIAFVLEKKSDLTRWINEINRLLTGSSAQQTRTSNSMMAIPGAEAIAATVAGTIDVFKGAFARSKRETAKIVSTRCPSCNSSVKGRQGDTVQCEYCGTHIMLN